jgi:hypothetical protein
MTEILELDLLDNNPVFRLSKKIYLHVEKLLGDKLIESNKWKTIQIVSDKYLESTYESEVLIEKYKQCGIIHDKLIYIPDLTDKLEHIKSLFESYGYTNISKTQYLVELHMGNSTSNTLQIMPPFGTHQDDFG